VRCRYEHQSTEGKLGYFRGRPRGKAPSEAREIVSRNDKQKAVSLTAWKLQEIRLMLWNRNPNNKSIKVFSFLPKWWSTTR
jgi:hypothetical protein